MKKALVGTSKFLSRVLRHKPESIGLTLDPEGWASVDDLVRLAGGAGHPLTRDELEEVVRENDKRRFSLSADGTRIRARQGHSVDVDLGLAPADPPTTLYHGTVDRFLGPIRREGLKARGRRHVHLSTTRAIAESVGARRGSPAILEIDALAMSRAGLLFYLSENGVWLTEAVPKEYIRFPEKASAE